MLFDELNYAVRSAEDGISALQKIREEEPQVILSDLQMPGMSGFEFLSVVHRRFPQIHVVAMSGAYAGAEIPDGIAADGFYAKGSGVRALIEMVAAWARENHLAASHARSATKPLWIPSNGHDHAGQDYVTIACPDCFRTFPQVLAELEPVVQQTNCVHCARPIHFAIVRRPTPLEARHALTSAQATEFAQQLERRGSAA